MNILRACLVLIVFALDSTGTFVQAQVKDYPIQPVPFTQVNITDQFWSHRLEVNRVATIPYAFKKCEELGRMDNFAIAGDLRCALPTRLADEVLSQKPDLVFIYVGVNDVWHKKSFGTGTDADKFGRFYEALLKKLAAQDIGAVLCTPAVIGEKTNSANELDNDLNQYSQIIRNIAGKYDYPLCDLRQAFLDYLAKNNSASKASGVLTTDGVHLNDAGNQFVAEQMLKFIHAR